MVSMKMIAERCKVSVATVSKALSDRGDIGEDTKNRIRQTAKEMGYVPNVAARALKTKHSYNIGVLFIEDRRCLCYNNIYGFCCIYRKIKTLRRIIDDR